MRSQILVLSSLHIPRTYLHCSDYGGWPETKAEIPMTFMTKQHRETIRQYCTRNAANAVFPDLPTSRNGEDEDKSDDDEAEDKWDLIEVITVKDLKKKKPKRCQDDGCSSGMFMMCRAYLFFVLPPCFVDSMSVILLFFSCLQCLGIQCCA